MQLHCSFCGTPLQPLHPDSSYVRNSPNPDVGRDWWAAAIVAHAAVVHDDSPDLPGLLNKPPKGKS